MRRRTDITRLIAACWMASACAAAPRMTADAVPPANQGIITAAEIEAAGGMGTASDLIRRLRPSWATPRGATNFRGTGSTMISFDGGQLESVDGLQEFPVSNVRELRLLNATDAAQRFGNSSHGAKVILVTRK